MPLSNADTLISTHIKRARRHAARFALRFHDLDSGDVISSAHGSLVLAAHRYDDRGHSFWTYARYRIEGAIRELAREQTIDAIPYLDDLAFAPEDQTERRILIRQLLADLPERGKRVLIGYYLEGRTMRQIAESLGITEMRVSQLRRQLLAQLDPRTTDQAA